MTERTTNPITVRIDRLVIDGMLMERHNAPLLQAALQVELSDLLTRGGLAPSLQTGGALPELRAGDLSGEHGGDPTILGREIAHAIYDGLGGTRLAQATGEKS